MREKKAKIPTLKKLSASTKRQLCLAIVTLFRVFSDSKEGATNPYTQGHIEGETDRGDKFEKCFQVC